MKADLDKSYKIIRILIYFFPAAAVFYGAYLILFPVENFLYLERDPAASKLEIERYIEKNEIAFGVFPDCNYSFAKIDILPKKDATKNCRDARTEICLEKAYRSFLYPEGDPIKNQEELREILFRNNNTKFANGSLLHLVATDEVFLISKDGKTLFPGPEIFRAYGYNFDNLTDVGKSTLDQFPDSKIKALFWNHPHPEGTLFKSYPSRRIYVIDGKTKRLIQDESLIKEVWPKYFTIAVSDSDPESYFCKTGDTSPSLSRSSFRFELDELREKFGGYYYFMVKYPRECSVSNLEFKKIDVDFISGKSYQTAKDSLRNIFASILNRYLYKENI